MRYGRAGRAGIRREHALLFAREGARVVVHDFDPAPAREEAEPVAYLSTAECELTGRVFAVHGGLIQQLDGWRTGESYETVGPWTAAGLAAAPG